MTAVGSLHARLVFDRRTRVLSAALAEALPPDSTRVLDVGCGDGTISRMIMDSRPGLSLTGVDVLVRPETHIPVTQFDGTHLPFEDGSFDAVMFVDVLHHTVDPAILLREARRVARKAVVLKDHSRDSLVSGPILRFMDWVGNAPWRRPALQLLVDGPVERRLPRHRAGGRHLAHHAGAVSVPGQPGVRAQSPLRVAAAADLTRHRRQQGASE